MRRHHNLLYSGMAATVVELADTALEVARYIVEQWMIACHIEHTMMFVEVVLQTGILGSRTVVEHGDQRGLHFRCNSFPRLDYLGEHLAGD